jgi:hypothetical protein
VFLYSELQVSIFLIYVVKNFILYLPFEKSIRNIISIYLSVVYNGGKAVGEIAGGFSAFPRASAGR